LLVWHFFAKPEASGSQGYQELDWSEKWQSRRPGRLSGGKVGSLGCWSRVL